MRKKSNHAPIKIYKTKIIQDGGKVGGRYTHPLQEQNGITMKI